MIFFVSTSKFCLNKKQKKVYAKESTPFISLIIRRFVPLPLLKQKLSRHVCNIQRSDNSVLKRRPSIPVPPSISRFERYRTYTKKRKKNTYIYRCVSYTIQYIAELRCTSQGIVSVTLSLGPPLLVYYVTRLSVVMLKQLKRKKKPALDSAFSTR